LCAAEPGGVASRFLDHTQPSLEAQLCNLADEIAYNAHDIDDGVRSGLLAMDELDAIPVLDSFVGAARREYPQLTGRRLLFESVRRMLSSQVYDVIETTRSALTASEADGIEAVRRAPALVRFSDEARRQNDELKRFLRINLYRHPQVAETTDRAKQVIRDLFDAYHRDPQQMASGFSGRPDTVRAVCDYVAGMTDRFAIKEHQRLTGRSVF
jgi:dGTPase